MKFLIADDHGIFRCGLRMILRDLYTSCEVLEASSGQEAYRLLEQNPDIDLAFLDLSLPDYQGLKLLAELKQQYFAIPFAVISATEDADIIQSAIAEGVSGYIPKSAANAVIASAIQLMMSGGMYVPQELLLTQGAKESAPTDANLTPRQLEVLGLLAEGMSNKQIGSQLSIAPGTIKAHIAAIFRELNVVNRTQAVHRARKMQLL